jgi:hypothetical protein
MIIFIKNCPQQIMQIDIQEPENQL